MDGLPISAIWKISIHTPTRGATNIVAAQQLHNIISIHTPAWGATRATRSQGKGNQNFNPHSRVGSDGNKSFPIILISKFQSTLPRGERRWVSDLRSSSRHFNPHSRVGSDHKPHPSDRHINNFNPHSRVGSDNRLYI